MAKQAEVQDKGLEDLFHDTLKDIYFAEKQILKALPKMSKAAVAPDLKKAFQDHQAETEEHIDRLEQIFESMGKPARGKTCDAILGILEEGKEIIEDYKGSHALDAGLISSAQAVEHYEMTRYGTLRAWANQLGDKSAADLLQKTLGEEEAADRKLSGIAKTAVNMKAKAA